MNPDAADIVTATLKVTNVHPDADNELLLSESGANGRRGS